MTDSEKINVRVSSLEAKLGAVIADHDMAIDAHAYIIDTLNRRLEGTRWDEPALKMLMRRVDQLEAQIAVPHSRLAALEARAEAIEAVLDTTNLVQELINFFPRKKPKTEDKNG